MASTIDNFNKQVKSIAPLYETDLNPAGTILVGNKAVIGTSPSTLERLSDSTSAFYTYEIRTNNAGNPSATVLGTGTVTMPIPSVTVKLMTVSGLSGFDLAGATLYWLVCKDASGIVLSAQSFLTIGSGKLTNVRVFIANNVGTHWLFTTYNFFYPDQYPDGMRKRWNGSVWSAGIGDHLFTITMEDDTNIQMADTSSIVDSYYIQSSMKDFYGISDHTASVDLADVLGRTLSAGLAYEEWTASDLSQVNPYIGGVSRLITATTTAGTDERILDPRTNLAIFDGVTNQIDPARIILSDEDDYIHMDIYVEDTTNLDQVASKLQFFSDDGVTNFSIDFNKALNAVQPGFWNTLVFRKGDFTLNDPNSLALGARSAYWTECSYKVARTVRSSVGEVDVYFSSIVHKARSSKYSNRGLPLTLGAGVSDDNGETWFEAQTFSGRSTNTDSQSDVIAFEAKPYLELVKATTMPKGSWEYGTSTSNPSSLAGVLENLLEQFNGTSTISVSAFDVILVRYINIDDTIQLDQYLKLICLAGLLNVATDDNGLVNILNANNYFVDPANNGFLDPRLYKEFKEIASTDTDYYNRVVIKGGVRTKVVNSAPFTAGLGTTVYLSIEEQRPANANATTTFVFDKDQLVAEPINNDTASLYSWNFGLDEATTTWNNTGMELLSVRVLGGNVLVTFKNTTAVVKFLRTIRIISQATLVIEEIEIEESNQASIDEFGLKVLEIDSPFVQTYASRYLALQVLEKYSRPTARYELDMSYIPNITIGQKYLVRDLQNKTVLTVVEGIDTIYDRTGLISRLTLRQDYIGVEGSFGTTRPYLSANRDALLNVLYDGTNPPLLGYRQTIPNDGWHNLLFSRQAGITAFNLSNTHYSILNGLGTREVVGPGGESANAGVELINGEVYKISYRAVFSSNSVGSRHSRLRLFNGTVSELTLEDQTIVTASGVTTMAGEVVYNCNVSGRNVRLQVAQLSGGDLTMVARECYLRVVRIA